MKFRASILLTCMLVVPGLAMFSHHVPAAVRDSLRRSVWTPAHDAASAVAGALSFAAAPAQPAESPFTAAEPPSAAAPSSPTPAPSTQPPPRPRPAVNDPPTPARVVMPTVTVTPANRIAEQIPPEGKGLAVPIATARAAERSFTQPPRQTQPATPPHTASAPEPSAERLPLPPQAEATSPQPTADPQLATVSRGADIATIRQRLADLGAFGIECLPLAGGGAGYASTCRMRIDRAGELQRMFHGLGPDAAAAMHSLMIQVETWKGQQGREAKL